MNIQELEKEFNGCGEVSGMKFIQVSKSEYGYIYEVHGTGTKHYEVFEKKLVPVCISFEKREYSKTDFKVSYPTSKQFGISAWTASTAVKAKLRLEQLNNDVAERIDE